MILEAAFFLQKVPQKYQETTGFIWVSERLLIAETAPSRIQLFPRENLNLRKCNLRFQNNL